MEIWWYKLLSTYWKTRASKEKMFHESAKCGNFNAKKKTISRQDVEKAIDAVDALAFLDGAIDD